MRYNLKSCHPGPGHPDPPPQVAGTQPHQLRAVALERAPGSQDRPLTGRPERPCSNCGRLFAPTLRRRMLCLRCFTGGDDGPLAA